MHDIPLFVRERRLTLSPDLLLAWRLVGWAGLALLLACAVDVLLAGRMNPGVGNWRASALADVGHLLVLGVTLALASGIARGDREITQAGVGVSAALALALLVTALVQVITAPSGVEVATEAGARFVRQARLHAAGLAVVCALALIALGAVAWRHALRRARVPIDH